MEEEAGYVSGDPGTDALAGTQRGRVAPLLKGRSTGHPSLHHRSKRKIIVSFTISRRETLKRDVPF